MAKIKNLFLLIFVAVIGIVLVGCNPTVDPVEEPDDSLPAPTELEVLPTIYDGSEKDPYVLIGNKMYLDAIVNDGADDAVTWAVSNEKGKLTVEDNRAIVEGMKGGNVVITATSVADPSKSASYTIEVVESEDFTVVLGLAKEQILAAMPEYATGEFVLPVPENENVQVIYRSKTNEKWADGKFHAAYSEKEGDLLYGFSFKLSFKGQTQDSQTTIRLVKDAAKNDFTAIDFATAKVNEFMADKIAVENGSQKISEATVGMAKNADFQNMYALALPGNIAAEEAGQDVEITWDLENETSGLMIKQSGSGTYYLVYDKPLADTRVQLNANYKTGNNRSISKLFVISAGYTPEEVLAYFQANKLTPTGGNQAKANFTVSTVDTTKKFKKVTVVYSVPANNGVLSYTAPTGTATSGIFKKVAAGETDIIATFYYGLVIRDVEVDAKDANGNLIYETDPETGAELLDENGKKIVKKVTEKQESYTWKQEFVIHVQIN